MKLAKRISRLEGRSSGAPTILHFADGSTRRLAHAGLHLYGVARKLWAGGKMTPAESQQLDWVRGSSGVSEPGDAHMMELLRAILNSPV